MVPAFAVGVPIVLAPVFLFLFIDGAIGAATAIAACFALGAIAITTLLVHANDDVDGEQRPWLRE